MRMRRSQACLAIGVLALTGCTTDSASAPEPSAPATVAQSSPTQEPSPTDSSATPSSAPATELLDWRPVEGPVDDEVTRSSTWTVTVPAGNQTARIEGPESLELGSG